VKKLLALIVVAGFLVSLTGCPTAVTTKAGGSSPKASPSKSDGMPTMKSDTGKADTGKAEPKDTGKAEPKDTGKAEPKDTGKAEPKDTGKAEPKDTGKSPDTKK